MGIGQAMNDVDLVGDDGGFGNNQMREREHIYDTKIGPADTLIEENKQMLK